MIYLLTGVAGSGKTTIGEKLAEKLRIPFYDGDRFHPSENIRKMAAGMPLVDSDRWEWLRLIRLKMNEVNESGKSAVFACSALKKRYRDILTAGMEDRVLLVFLAGTPDILRRRLQDRRGHYMKPSMLESQFRDLEVPSTGLHVDITADINAIVDTIIRAAGERT